MQTNKKGIQQILRMHNGKHDINSRNKIMKTNVNGNSSILIHKQVIEIKGWIKNDMTFTRHSPTFKCLGFVFTSTLMQRNTIICLTRLNSQEWLAGGGGLGDWRLLS